MDHIIGVAAEEVLREIVKAQGLIVKAKDKFAEYDIQSERFFNKILPGIEPALHIERENYNTNALSTLRKIIAHTNFDLVDAVRIWHSVPTNEREHNRDFLRVQGQLQSWEIDTKAMDFLAQGYPLYEEGLHLREQPPQTT